MVFVCDEDFRVTGQDTKFNGWQRRRLAAWGPGRSGAASLSYQYFAHGGGRPDPVPLLSRGQVWTGCGLQASGEP